MDIPIKRKVLFQIPLGSKSNLINQIGSINENIGRFNEEYKTSEGVIVNCDTSQWFDTKDISVNCLDGLVILADEYYTERDLEESIIMYECPSLIDKPKIVFLYDNREENSLISRLKLQIEAIEEKSSVRTIYFDYPGKNTDPDFLFDGFNNVGDAFYHLMQFPRIRMDFLGYIRNFKDLMEYQLERANKNIGIDSISANTALARLTELDRFVHNAEGSENVIPFQFKVDNKKKKSKR